MNRKPSYDCIVVGSGIAGLYVAQQLSNKNPKWTIAICERYKGLGGRTYSYSPPGFEGVSWEMGAGRVHKSHKLLMNLIKKYKLTWIPISDEIAYQKSPGAPLEPNLFESVFIPIYLEPLSRLSPKLLATHTIYELLELFYGPHAANEILNPFPYRAEVFTLRADLALQSFLGGGEMSSHKGYGVLKEGFGELVARMRADLESRGCVVLQRHRVLNMKKGPGKA
jgi:phytoene dehydrogenase-like protein